VTAVGHALRDQRILISRISLSLSLSLSLFLYLSLSSNKRAGEKRKSGRERGTMPRLLLSRAAIISLFAAPLRRSGPGGCERPRDDALAFSSVPREGREPDCAGFPLWSGTADVLGPSRLVTATRDRHPLALPLSFPSHLRRDSRAYAKRDRILDCVFRPHYTLCWTDHSADSPITRFSNAAGRLLWSQLSFILSKVALRATSIFESLILLHDVSNEWILRYEQCADVSKNFYDRMEDREYSSFYLVS